MRTLPHRLASWIYAVLFGCVATYHFFILLDAEMPHAVVVRHLIFFVVDAAFAVLIWKWPRWLLIPCGVLTVQQIWSHGGHVWNAWRHGQIAAFGTFVLSALIVLMILLVRETRTQHRA